MSTTQKLMTVHCLERRLISKVYKCLIDRCTEASVERLEAWREDLHEDISMKKVGGGMY